MSYENNQNLVAVVGRIIAVGALALLLLACVEFQKPQVSKTNPKVVHLYQPDWERADFLLRTGADAALARHAMTAEGDGWWRVEVVGDNLEFAFSDGAERISLGRTRGCYQGSHYPCASYEDPDENFRASAREIWVKNGLLYIADPDEVNAMSGRPKIFTVLSINLHTYQEFTTAGKTDSQLSAAEVAARVRAHGPLFDRIARAIDALAPDAVCLQEVGEWKGDDASFGKHGSNAARQILQRLNNPGYRAFMDWSHYGWDVWKEGTAVLSRHPLIAAEARYISDTSNGTHGFWKSRKISRVQIQPSGFAPINIFSVHAGWWNDPDEPFQQQFQRLRSWADEAPAGQSSLMCGDFNQEAGSEGYRFLTQASGYSDQYLRANPEGMYDATIGGKIAGWENSAGGKRIDFLLLDDNSPLVVKQAQRIFTERVYGRVSDHVGVYAQFILAQ